MASASWGLFFGGLVLAIPAVGDVVVPGHLVAVVVSDIESAVVLSGLSAIGAAFYRIEIFKDSVFRYIDDFISNGFLVIGHGSADEAARPKDL